MESSVGGSAAIGVPSAVARQANAARLGATAANQLATSAAGQVSFSSSWQSLLASLGTGGRESEEAEKALPAAETPLAAADGGASTTSASAWTASLHASLATEQGRDMGQSATSSVRPQVSASQLTSAKIGQTASKTEVTKQTADAATDASGATRAAHSSKKATSDTRQTAVVPEAAQEPQAVVAVVPVTVNHLSAALAAPPASLETAVSLGFATGSSPSTSSRAGSTASRSATTSVSSTEGDSQAVRSTATASPAGNTNPLRAQTQSVSAPVRAPISSGSSGRTAEEQAVSTGGGSALPVEGATAQLPSSPGAFTGRSPAGQEQGQVPDAVQSQSALLQVQAGNDASPTAAIPSLTGKTAVAGRSRTSETETQWTARAAGKSGLTQQGIQVHGQQATTSSADAVTMVRDPSARGDLNTVDDAARGSSGAASGLKETFAALDAEGATGKSTWIHAGAQRAEAGIQDPELGWVGVRADMGSGGIHASLVPGSADAAQTLGGHLAGLNSYLSDHHTPVETLTLAAPESSWSGPGAGAGQSMGQGQADPQGQNAAGSAEAGATSSLSSSPTSLTAADSRTSFQGFEEMKGNTSTVQAEGTHISVLA